MTGGILKHSESINFILAGNSVFTILNPKTGNRFTYRVKYLKSSKKDNPVYFVRVLTDSSYKFIGSIFRNKFRWSQKSELSNDEKSVVSFQYVFDRLLENRLQSSVEIWHEGMCGRCGRRLTVPESIEYGLGPDCLKMMNSTSIIRDKKLNDLLKYV
jgi:hypothetical protein